MVLGCVQAWPENALELVAHKFLENVDIGEREKQETVNMCKQFHTSAAILSEESAVYSFFEKINFN